MKIISLNVNNFGGIHNKPHPSEYDTGNGVLWNNWKYNVDLWRNIHKSEISTNVNTLLELVMNYDIIFLNEVDTNCDSFYQLLKTLEPKYEWVRPNGFSRNDYNRGRGSITCAFVRNGIDFEYSTYNFTDSSRNVEFTINDIHMIGIHMSGDATRIGDWDKLINRVKELNNDNILIIGDLNTFDEGTPRIEKLRELLSHGFCDVWLKQGNKHETPTFNTDKRIDYVIASEDLYKDITDVGILHDIRLNKHTDHSAVTVEIR